MFFDPSELKSEIKLAFSYSPKILNNYIKKRIRTGLLYVLSGEYIYSWDGFSFSGTSGSFIYLPPNCVPYNYQINTDGDRPIKTLQIEIEMTEIISGEPVAFSKHPQLISNHGGNAIRESFEVIISGQGKSDTASLFMIHSELYKLLSLCITHTLEAPLSSAYRSIAPALSFIQENYRYDFSVSELAALCHISESQLRRNFITALGKSPVSYKNELVFRDACKFLEAGEMGVGEIAGILGFCDSYAFSHFFKKHKGISATAYKADISKKKANN